MQKFEWRRLADRRSFKNLGIIYFVLSLHCLSFAQEVSVSARLDTNNVRIGDQVKLILEVSNKKKEKLTWPVIPDTIGKIEIIKRAPTDTVKTGTGPDIYRQSVTIASYDSGAFVIPAFRFIYKKANDTTHYMLQSEPLELYVRGIAVDTSKEIKDIKPPLEVPFSWKEFLKEYGWYIAGGIAVILAIALFFYWRARRKKPTPVAKPVIRRPAHEIAFEQLAAAEKEKLWQNGNYKEYHSRLSDIVRTYIEHRFGINAMELTTDEILASLKTMPAREKDLLRHVLSLSDLVKFAKASPINTENELSISYARDFIEATKAYEIAEKKVEVQKS